MRNVFEEPRQVIVVLNAEIIAKSNWTKDFRIFLSNAETAAASVRNTIPASCAIERHEKNGH